MCEIGAAVSDVVNCVRGFTNRIDELTTRIDELA
jgi:hypothetical protein